MAKSHVPGWAPDAPTPAQIKEFFAQIDNRKITKDHLQALLRGDVQVSTLFITDLSQRGFRVVRGKEGPLHPKGVTVADMELKEFLYRDEKRITGEKLQKRARELDANLGLHAAEYLLEHQEEIPKNWQGKYLTFVGTELLNSVDDRYVPCLIWDGKRWYLRFHWIGNKFYSYVRLVRISK